jgi:hypothetical protein
VGYVHLTLPLNLTSNKSKSGEAQDNYQQVYDNDQPHEAKLSHELIGGAAAFAGFKAFEDHQRNQGKKPKKPLCLPL